MSTQVITGFAVTSQGGVPLKTTLTDGSDSQELLTNSDYVVTEQSLGTFAEGATVSALGVRSTTGIAYAGILRNGQYIAVCQTLSTNALGGGNKYSPLLPGSVQLVAGDQIIVRCQA